jgi:Malectin domain
VFNVWVEGALAISNLDIVQAASGSFAAYAIPVQKTVSDGFVSIELVAVVENPMISAIEIIKLSSPTPVAAPVIAPVTAPVAAPISPPVTAPTNAPPPPTAPSFKDILINCGGKFLGLLFYYYL